MSHFRVAFPLFWEEQNTYTYMTIDYKLCSICDEVYELNALIFAVKIGIAQYKDE